MHWIIINKLVIFIFLGSLSACSSAKTEKVSATSKVSLNKKSSSSMLKKARTDQHKLQLDTCFDDEGSAQLWYKKSLDWQACSFPTQLYQCKGVLGAEGDGAVVRWALVKLHQKLNVGSQSYIFIV